MQHEHKPGDSVVVMSDFGQDDLPGTVVEVDRDGDILVSVDALHRVCNFGNVWWAGAQWVFSPSGKMIGDKYGLTIRPATPEEIATLIDRYGADAVKAAAKGGAA